MGEQFMALVLDVLTAVAILNAAHAADGTAPGGTLGGYTLAQAATPLRIPEAAPPPPADQSQPPAATPAPVPAQDPAPPASPPSASDRAAPAAPPPATEQPPAAEPDSPGAEEDGGEEPPEDFSLGEIPIIETIELTPDVARRALDSYLSAREKYGESGLEQFEELQEFVDQTEDGKRFEADIKAAGFKDVNDWNLAITTLGVTYGSVIDDQTSELLLQIQEVEADTELAQDIKDRMIQALRAMIPSDNNKKVVEELMADPAYAEKLKELHIEEE